MQKGLHNKEIKKSRSCLLSYITSFVILRLTISYTLLKHLFERWKRNTMPSFSNCKPWSIKQIDSSTFFFPSASIFLPNFLFFLVCHVNLTLSPYTYACLLPLYVGEPTSSLLALLKPSFFYSRAKSATHVSLN